MLIPKPFVFENTINGSVTKVYLPGQETEIHNKKYTCVCVHLCEKFATYPTLRFGVRCIPENAPWRTYFTKRQTNQHWGGFGLYICFAQRIKQNKIKGC